MNQQSGKMVKLSGITVTLSLINGMVGAAALFLPVFTLSAGYLSTIIVIMITGTFSYYASHLFLLHMGNEPDIDTVIFKHFNKSNKFKIFYDLCVFVQLILIDFSYFELIINQWIGIAPPHQLTTENVIANAVLLLVITILMKYFQSGIKLMAFGILSLVSYLTFVSWAALSEQDNHNHAELKAVGQGAIELSAFMALAFTIQAFFIPIVRKSENQKQNNKYVLIAFVIGGLAFIYISIMGSYGILHRQFVGKSQNQRSIQGYFDVGTWQVKIIQIIYLVHFYTVFPQFLLISKQRLFGVFKYPNSKKNQINMGEIIFICVSIGICVLIGFFQLNIRDIFDFNGAVIGGILYYFIPAALHIKCLYFSPQKIPLKQQNEQIIEDNKCIEEQNNHNKFLYTIKQIKQQQSIEGSKAINEQEQLIQFECGCHITNYTSKYLILDSLMVLIMVDFGIFVMCNGILTILKNHNLIQ